MGNFFISCVTISLLEEWCCPMEWSYTAVKRNRAPL